MIRIDTRPRRKNAPRPAEKSAPAYLQWLRGRKCLVAEERCAGRIEAAHTYGTGDRGMNTKSSDWCCVPMCSHHHREQHTMGWKSFEQFHGIGPANMAARAYWRMWPGRIAWEKKNAP